MESVCDDPEIIAENIKVNDFSGDNDKTLLIILHFFFYTGFTVNFQCDKYHSY